MNVNRGGEGVTHEPSMPSLEFICSQVPCPDFGEANLIVKPYLEITRVDRLESDWAPDPEINRWHREYGDGNRVRTLDP